VTLREEHRLKVFENRVLRRIFGQKRNEVIGGWRKLYNEEFHNVYSSSIIIRMMKSRRMGWTGQVAQVGKKRNAYRILVGKPEGKRPLGRPVGSALWDWPDAISMLTSRAESVATEVAMTV
jgi:hypothetical protein